MASEGASLLLMYGAVTGLAAHMDCPECNNTGINLMAYSVLFLFFGGWIIDFGDAPNQIIKDKNRAISGNGLSFSTNKKTVFLKFTINLK